MESKVEMTLEEYTNIIKENERLKCMLHDCTRQLFNKLKDAVKGYAIDKFTKEECDKSIVMESDKLIDKYGYTYSFTDACREFPCFSRDEVEKTYGDIIRNKIRKRIEELEGD